MYFSYIDIFYPYMVMCLFLIYRYILSLYGHVFSIYRYILYLYDQVMWNRQTIYKDIKTIEGKWKEYIPEEDNIVSL